MTLCVCVCALASPAAITLIKKVQIVKRAERRVGNAANHDAQSSAAKSWQLLMNELKCGTVSQGCGGVRVCVLHWAAGTRWLQVTCCTSVACLVIKRIIISCGVQPKKKTTQCTSSPSLDSLHPPHLLHFNSHLPRLHFCMHFYYERPKTRCDAQQTKRISQTKRMRRRCFRAWSAIATTPPLPHPHTLSPCLGPQERERSRLWSVLNEVAASRCLAALRTQIKTAFSFFCISLLFFRNKKIWKFILSSSSLGPCNNGVSAAHKNNDYDNIWTNNMD